VATIVNLGDRLRSEIGDIGKSFVHQIVADGTTNRFLLPYSPLDGLNLIVTKNSTDISSAVEVEEATGFIVLDTTPQAGDIIIAAGNYFRYFTTAEIQQFVSTAFIQHTTNHTDAYGRNVSIQNLPVLEEYPIVVYASTLAMYTLATDASFDIDITAPDGVMIPRSERYRQLMQMIDVRKNQYKELCSQLGIGLYKIDVFSLRRISKTTNRYIPIYMPQEVDDISMPDRVYLPIPTYGAEVKPTTAIIQDLYVYAGDNYSFDIQFGFELDAYTAKAEIRMNPDSMVLLTSFSTSLPDLGDADGAGLRTLRLTLTTDQTRLLPGICYYDVQLTDGDGITHTYVTGKVFVTSEVTQ
jgi:hypothetical protein